MACEAAVRWWGGGAALAIHLLQDSAPHQAPAPWFLSPGHPVSRNANAALSPAQSSYVLKDHRGTGQRGRPTGEFEAVGGRGGARAGRVLLARAGLCE